MRPKFTVAVYALALGFALSAAPGHAAGRSGKPVGTADGPGDVALAIGTTGAAAAATGLWLRSRYRRDEAAGESAPEEER
ncbi:hypothetical protein [Streptomyces sp. NPDC089919]|uniref:hypothetical protein n=1 Tax=Streptomyces sp. NPDC089919 TaxID=3155188 RepID=UPI003422B08D